TTIWPQVPPGAASANRATKAPRIVARARLCSAFVPLRTVTTTRSCGWNPLPATVAGDGTSRRTVGLAEARAAGTIAPATTRARIVFIPSMMPRIAKSCTWRVRTSPLGSPRPSITVRGKCETTEESSGSCGAVRPRHRRGGGRRDRRCLPQGEQRRTDSREDRGDPRRVQERRPGRAEADRIEDQESGRSGFVCSGADRCARVSEELGLRGPPEPG